MLAPKLTAAAAFALFSSSAIAQDTEAPVDYWNGVGSASYIWHNRYHGLLAMAASGDFRTSCRSTFTAESLHHQYPGNTNDPFQVVGTFNTSLTSGYVARVPEMNKIVTVFRDNYDWHALGKNDLVAFPEAGCRNTSHCLVHRGAYEAWQELKVGTNDFAVVKENQGDLVWSSSGHGWGGMVAQTAALDLKNRGLLFSIHTFGSPAVFNQATVDRWDDLFIGDATQRTIANLDSVPTMIPLANDTALNYGYAHVSTGIHVFGTSPMYGQDSYQGEGGNRVRECWGTEVSAGGREADHYFYYTEDGTCGTSYDQRLDHARNNRTLASYSASFARAGKTRVAVVTDTPATSTTSSSVTSAAQTAPAPATSNASAAASAPNSAAKINASVDFLAVAVLAMAISAWLGI